MSRADNPHALSRPEHNLHLKGPVPFLTVKSNCRATNLPPTPTIFSNTSNKNFEIAILFNVVENSGNYVF
jgi:hypothetical protein